MLNRYLDIAPEVKKALDEGKPVVALESTIISHGMPYPQNKETALKVEEIIRSCGAVPATIAIIGVEGRQLLGAVADDGDALGLQVFQGQAQVQNGLGSGADHQHRGLGQLLQVGGNVHGGFRAPMHAAESPE